MPHIAERELELPDAIIGKLISLLHDKRVISLGAGEPDFDLPKPLVAYLKRIANKTNKYSPPGGIPELKIAIAKKLRKENRIHAEPENIVVTGGSQEALLLAAACALDVGEQAIVPNPSFLAYLPTVELLSAAPVFADTAASTGWELDPDEVRRRIDKKKTKVLIINTPGNPTGNVLKRKTLEELADIAVDNDLYMFSDEAYEKIIYGKKHVSIASLNGMERYAVTFQTFSKSYAMCGFRLGYCAAPPKLAAAITKIHVYTSICAPTVSQMLGIKALSLPEKYTSAMVTEYRKRRDYIVKRLNETGLRTVKPEGAFYAFAHVGKDDRRFAFDLLKKAHVAVVPGSEFGTAGKGYIRLSFATKLPLIKQAMDRMERFVR
ncbi:MAG: aminotransferase class I/II-fold pyridoxal phosphate-dependent enzyme [Candidatus Aenigmarchaeota archaeon]|nr:aminotransferase class I/II-fold pyridoxal phosphate-dependent enzyme [Candidatus Aenigmarchaeota archaeon]